VIDTFYIAGNSFLHRLPAAAKLVFIAMLGTAVFLCRDLYYVGAALVGIIALYGVAHVPPGMMFRQLKFSLILLAIIFSVQWLVADWQTGLLIILRFAVLILAASLVTLTTRTSDMVEALERILQPLRHFGLDVAKVSLCLSLTIRFIPEVARITQQVREAQRARGLEHSILAVAMPVIIRLLRMADEIAEAIEARTVSEDTPR